jgi:hypothetical protein
MLFHVQVPNNGEQDLESGHALLAIDDLDNPVLLGLATPR